MKYIRVSKTIPHLLIIFSIPPSLWPPNSPDLNPVWGILQERVYKYHRIMDMEELRQRVDKEWDRLDPELIDNAISEWHK